MGSPALGDRVDPSCYCLSSSLSELLPATLRNCDNWDKLIQLLLEDIRSRGSQQHASRQGVAAAVGQGRAEEAQAAPPSSASPPAEEPGSLKAALSEGRAKSN